MIHTLKILHGGHTFLFRYRSDRLHALRQQLARNAIAGNFPLNKAFAANRDIIDNLEGSKEMDQLEEFRRKLVAIGFFPNISATDDGWQCLLMNSVVHRPPFGRGTTVLEAIVAADVDRVELMKKAKK